MTRRDYFMSIADAVAARATCDRAHVGCIFVREDRIIATGYNGAPSGLPHCEEIGHDLEGGHCVRTMHAEENAIVQCALYGISSRGARCYVTHHPCYACARRLYGAGIVEVVYRHLYETIADKERESIARLVRLGYMMLVSLDACEGVSDETHDRPSVY